MKKLAPIALFVYNRPKHTKQTIEALKKNKLASESELFIFSDAAKNEREVENVRKVREYIKAIDGFKKITIIESKKNKGLANSIINGVTELINKYGKIIVLEDDLITSINFLEYMNEALEFYKEDKRIWSISGYNPNINIGNYTKDIYLNYRASSWGWATWKDRWEKNDWEISDYKEFIKNKKLQKEFNRGGDDMTEMLIAQIEGKIDSWAIRWCYNQFKYKMYTIYPIVSKVKNIGMDGTGVHCGVNYNYDVVLDDGRKKIEFDLNLSEDKKLLKEFKKTFEPKTIKGKIGKHLKKIGLYNIVKGWIR